MLAWTAAAAACGRGCIGAECGDAAAQLLHALQGPLLAAAAGGMLQPRAVCQAVWAYSWGAKRDGLQVMRCTRHLRCGLICAVVYVAFRWFSGWVVLWHCMRAVPLHA